MRRARRSGGPAAAGRWLFLVCLVVTFANFAVWSWATPLFASPDEPTQVARAAAVVRGQFVGATVGSDLNAVTNLRIPAVFAQDPGLPECFQFRPTVPASCEPALPTSTKVVTIRTYVGRYPPLYYLVVGLPSLVAESARGVYLMRLMSGLLGALFVSLALFAVARWSKRKLLLVAVMVAATPMVWFLGGVVNPSGLEICAAICVWTSGAVLVLEHSHDPPPGLVAVVAGSLAALVLTRPLSPLWCAVALVVLCVAGGWRHVRALFSARAVQLAALPVAACAAYAGWWILEEHSLDLAPSTTAVPGPYTVAHIVPLIVDHFDFWSKQLVGVFGWLDTFSPRETYAIWAVVFVAAVLLGLVRAGGRQRLALVLLVVACFVVPVAIVYSQVHRLGIVWQGKDMMPIVVGIPIVAVAVGTERELATSARRAVPVLTAAVCGLMAVAQYGAFFDALRRYAVGVGGPLDFLHGTWSPPVGTAAALAAGAGAIVLLEALVCVAVLRARRAPNFATSPGSLMSVRRSDEEQRVWLGAERTPGS